MHSISASQANQTSLSPLDIITAHTVRKKQEELRINVLFKEINIICCNALGTLQHKVLFAEQQQ